MEAKMNQSGIVIAGIGLLIGIALFLILGLVVLTFLKHLILFALALGVFAFGLLYVPELSTKKDALRNTVLTWLVAGVLLAVSFLPIGSFSFFGIETPIALASINPNELVMVTGLVALVAIAAKITK